MPVAKECLFGWYPDARDIYDNPKANKLEARECLKKFYRKETGNVPTPTNTETSESEGTGSPFTRQVTVALIGPTATKAQLLPRSSTSTSGRKNRPTTSASTSSCTGRKNRPTTSTSASSYSSSSKSASSLRSASAINLRAENSSSVRSSSRPVNYDSLKKAFTEEFTRPQSPRPTAAEYFRSNPVALSMKNIPEPDFSHSDSSSTIMAGVNEASSFDSSSMKWTSSTKSRKDLDDKDSASSRDYQVFSELSDQKRVTSAVPRRRTCPVSSLTKRPYTASPSISKSHSKTSFRSSRCQSSGPSSMTSGSKVSSKFESYATLADFRTVTAAYDTALKTYGWRAQVHGDPLNVKSISKRLPYTVKCNVGIKPLHKTRVKAECMDTYFYNTIPRKHATFSIHPEMISEVLHAKRMELQKKEGIDKYRYTNFSFVY